MTIFDQSSLPTDRFAQASAQQVLKWAYATFQDRVALACSFGAEDVVLVHMTQQVAPGFRVFSLDTGRLNTETYETMDRLRSRYDLDIQVMFPRADGVQTMVRQHGINLFYDSIERRKECCSVRKLEPLKRILGSLDAWATGLRRGQNVTRADIAKVEWDQGNSMVKLNPLADWSDEDVWKYIDEHNVPFNPLHKRGYPSIGCAPCTRSVQPDEDPRAGRWWWENPETKECGLHLPPPE
jgi:phosphoadenosine phosphosulfate reductase